MHERVLDFLQEEINEEHIPGATIHISYKGEVVLQEALGNRVVFPQESPMKLDTIFDLASLTKVVVTTPIILSLIDTGTIRLDDRVSHFLPEFSQNGKQDITIRNLLTHTSGLVAHRRFYNKELTQDQIIEQIYSESPNYKVGSKVVYSDLGFIILYKIVETVTEVSFPKFAYDNIFKPLEMSETAFLPKFNLERYAATAYSEKINGFKRGIVHDSNTEAMGGISGHAGLFSTIKDLGNFASMIENNGIFKGKCILSEPVLNLSTQNYTSFDDEWRGLGWMMKSPRLSSSGDLFSSHSFGHTGYTGTSIWFDPSIDLHVILLTNRVHFAGSQHIIRLRPRLHNIIRSHF